MNITKTLRGLFSLAAVDWMMFVWVCTKILKTSKFRSAIEEDVLEMASRPCEFPSYMREAAYFMLLQCEGDFPRSFLCTCVRTKRPHVLTLAKLRGVGQGLWSRFFAELYKNLPQHSGDLHDIATLNDINHPDFGMRNLARMKLLIEKMKEVSHSDVCSWAMSPYEPGSISVPVLADLQFCTWFDLPSVLEEEENLKDFEVTLYTKLRSKTYLSKEGSGVPCAWRIAPELLAQAKFS